MATYPTIPLSIGIRIVLAVPFAALVHNSPFSSSRRNTEARSHIRVSHVSITNLSIASLRTREIEILWKVVTSLFNRMLRFRICW